MHPACYTTTGKTFRKGDRQKMFFVCSGEKAALVRGKLIEMGRFSGFNRYSGEYVKLARAGVSPMISPT